MSREMLVSVVEARDNTIHHLRANLAQQALVPATHAVDSAFAIGRPSTRLTTRGDLAAGLRQIMSHGPAANLGLSLLDKVHRTSVTRCEESRGSLDSSHSPVSLGARSRHRILEQFASV
jgi:hypothetical protein